MHPKFWTKNFNPETVSDFRSYRLLQVSSLSLIGLLAALLVAHGITFIIIACGASSIVFASFFAVKRKVLVSAHILVWSLAGMLSMLALTGAGLLDLAMLGYAGLLVFAALLGSIGLFTSLLCFVVAQCVLLTWLTLNGHITPHTPTLSWPHLVFVLVIFLITGYSVYLMARDMRRLMTSLQQENAKVLKSKLKIQHLAHHDSLTNLPNRLFGEQLFQKSLLTSIDNKQQLALLFIDLDNFKPVNDALGHAAGDDLLRQLTARLTAILPPDHHIIRFGGDEFLILAPFSDKHQLTLLTRQLIQQTTTIFTILQTQVTVSASVGIACAPDDGHDFKQLCRKADIAMYRAKADGRNTFHFYDDSLDQANEDKFRLLQRLRQALSDKQFAIYLQPKIQLQTGEITSVEALLRWPQQDGSMIGPDTFIPLAESSGLINELGAWVLQQACLCCARMRANGYAKLRIAVNLSVVQFNDGSLPQKVQQALAEAGLPADALELELTESLLLGDTELIQQQLSAISALGVTFAIDDFGTGYSNLSYLRRFNATTLKIDRSFIATFEQWQANEPLIHAIIQMASSLGLTTVAEGIENADLAQRLTKLGCNEGQGYYWSPAVPEAHLSALLTRLTN